MCNSDVVIAGAGIIGLSIALELAGHGLSVTVLEQGAAMREASWAAAGMLAAHDPENPAELRALAEFSLSLYPSFLARIEQLSGLRVPLRTSMTLQSVRAGARHQLDDARAFVPDLVAGAHAFIRLDEQSLDPRDLCRALPVATRAAGVQLLEQTAVEEVEQAGGQVTVATSSGIFSARRYVHCCGAWSGTSLALPVEPRKGQILAVTLPAGLPRLACVVRTPEIYLVPRGNGRVVVGATVERAGFDRTSTNAAAEELLAAAAELWPPIRAGVVKEHWTGLRPSTPDALPIIDRMGAEGENASNVWVATGHFRNGILLAPGTARLLAQAMLGGEPAIGAFRAERFAALEAS